MKKLLNTLILTLSVMFIPTSCVMYHPHNVDIPLLHQQGDLRVDASVSGTLPLIDGSGMNASVSYAPVNHLGLQVSGSVTELENLYGQAAVGGFVPFGKSVLEGYVGYGIGHSNYESNSSSNKNYTVGGRYDVVYGQLNFGWNDLANGVIDVGIGVRGGMLKPQWKKVAAGEDASHDGDFEYTEQHPLIEPQLVFRAGNEHVKFAINVVYSYVDGWPTDNNHINRVPFSLGLGIYFKF